jgi:hypothetical protein
MHTSRRITVVTLAASLAIAAPLLTGCSLIPHPGGSGGGISLPGVSVGSGHLPKDWPSDVPVAKGDVISGASLGDAAKGKIWNATIKVAGASAGDDISAQLTGAGFTNQGGGSSDDGFTGAFQKDKYNVAVIVTKDDKDGWVANYTVTYDATDSGS